MDKLYDRGRTKLSKRYLPFLLPTLYVCSQLKPEIDYLYQGIYQKAFSVPYLLFFQLEVGDKIFAAVIHAILCFRNDVNAFLKGQRIP